MKKLLLITKEKENSSLERYLVCVDAYETRVSYSVDEAKELLNKEDYDIVAVNCPLDSEFGDDFSLWISEHNRAAVVAMMRNEISAVKRGNLESRGVYIISKPATKHHILKVLKYASICDNRIVSLSKEKERLERKLDSLNTISRAKIALVKYLNMSEEEAHKYIEREAMNRRISKLELAQKIIRNYEE